MKNYWVASDHHLGHVGVTKFLNADGTKLRPWDDPDEMDEEIIKRHNELVQPNDRVYFLGDVVINRRCLPTIARLNGKKVLIKGNHDIFRLEEYMQYFEDIRAYKVMPKERIIMSHIPVHPSQLERWSGNIHGHLHGNNLDDPRYINVSMEQIDYRPVLLVELVKKLER